MLNQTVLVGRLTKDPEIKELESGVKCCNLTIAVPRSYKNAEGEYETDFVDCTLWKGVAENTAEYCHKGDMVGVKGYLKTSEEEKDGNYYKRTSVVVEKITFLAAKKTNEQENEQNEDMEV